MLGERVLNVFLASGADIVAEDLGTVPDFVRASLDRLGVPGYKVFRWERHWNKPGQPFRDPELYAPTSVATSGTHDTEPMAVWWEQASVEERSAVLEIPSVRKRISADERTVVLERPELSNRLREALLEALYQSASELLILPVQDVFGWPGRINRPATVGNENWTWRLPWPTDRLATEPQAIAVADRLREWSGRSGRCG
jgi:4-alpha-glucanotransferase